MRLAMRFWLSVLLWGAGLTVLVAALSLLSGQAPGEVLAHLPTWSGLALAIAAFPAGATVSSEVLIPGDRRLGRLVLAGFAALSVSLAMFLLGNLIAPAVQRSLLDSDKVIAEAATLSLGDLREAARAAELRAVAATGDGAVREWRLANQLAWHYVRRTDGTLLPCLLGLLGMVAGFWSRRARRVELRQAQLWLLGLFLLVTTYLTGENSYELIVLRSAGPVYFAGDLVLVAPALLLLGIGWPTSLVLLEPSSSGGES